MILKYMKIITSVFLIQASLLAREWFAVGTGIQGEPEWSVEIFSSNEMHIIFDLQGYYLEKMEDGKIRITFPGGVPILEKGAPDLPCMASSIVIPDLGRMELEIIDADYVDIPIGDLVSC